MKILKIKSEQIKKEFLIMFFIPCGQLQKKRHAITPKPRKFHQVNKLVRYRKLTLFKNLSGISLRIKPQEYFSILDVIFKFQKTESSTI